MKFLETDSLRVVSFDRAPSEYAIFSDDFHQPLEGGTTHSAVHELCITSRNSEAWPINETSKNRHIRQACRRAREQNICYLWIKSECVDHLSSAEVAEAITALFHLIWDASLCIAYLDDLLPSTDEEDSISSLEKAILECRWFTYSWTLQHLVAARRLEFFDNDWNLRGTKEPSSSQRWLDMLSRASGVDSFVLADRDRLFDVSLGRRLSWAATRQASRPEDAVYALVGICGIAGRLTPRYGEGGRVAFLRLQEKIVKSTTDLSIFAWKRKENGKNIESHVNRQHQKKPDFSGILADSITNFQHFADHPAWTKPFLSGCEITFSNRGLCVRGLLSVDNRSLENSRQVVLFLDASSHSHPGAMHVGISLKEIEPGLFVRSDPQEVLSVPLQQGDITPQLICVRREIESREAHHKYTEDRESRVSAWVDNVLKQTCMPSVTPSKLPGQLPMDSESNVNGIPDDCIHRNAMGHHPRRPSKRDAAEMLELRHSTTDSSNEGNILLFDTLPEKPARLQNGHPLQALIPDLITLGLSAWNDEKAATAIRANIKRAPVTVVPINSSFGFSIPFRPRKRTRRDIERQANPYGDGDSVGSYTAETDHDEPDVLIVQPKLDLLACPFYKFDPIHYHSCMWELELADTHTIKQHVIVDHRVPWHCPLCREVFDSALERDRHIVARCCTEPDVPIQPLVGVSEDQADRLSREDANKRGKPQKMGSLGRGSRARIKVKGASKTFQHRSVTLSEEDKWFYIWDIIFPDTLPPETAYLSSPWEHEVVALRRFWRRSGPRLVADVMKNREMLPLEGHAEKTDLAALYASVLDGMIDKSGLLVHVTGRAGAIAPKTGDLDAADME